MSATTQPAVHRDELADGSRARPLAPLLLGALLLWLYLGIASGWTTGAAIPIAWALLGAYLVPTGLVLAASGRLPAALGLVPVHLLRSLLLGSLLAAVLAATAGDGIGRMLPLPGWAAALLIPAAAETLVLAAVVRVVGRRLSPTPRAGLFLGGAIGAGFSAFAALGAILRSLGALTGVPLPASVPPSALLEGGVTLSQAALGAITSPVWGALVGAAVFAAARSRLVLTLAGVLVSHVAVAALTAVAVGLLGTSPTAVAVQLALGALAAAPAALVWRTRSRRLRDQAGGA
jgi:hypothetical protein